jgi:hypothetical protein
MLRRGWNSTLLSNTLRKTALDPPGSGGRNATTCRWWEVSGFCFCKALIFRCSGRTAHYIRLVFKWNYGGCLTKILINRRF